MRDTARNRSVRSASALLRDERGVSAVEYVIMLALVALIAIGAWVTLGESVSQKVDCTARAVGGGGGPCGAGGAGGTGGPASPGAPTGPGAPGVVAPVPEVGTGPRPPAPNNTALTDPGRAQELANQQNMFEQMWGGFVSVFLGPPSPAAAAGGEAVQRAIANPNEVAKTLTGTDANPGTIANAAATNAGNALTSAASNNNVAANAGRLGAYAFFGLPASIASFVRSQSQTSTATQLRTASRNIADSVVQPGGHGSASQADADWVSGQLSATLPPEVLDRLRDFGVRVSVGRGSVVDVHPWLHNVHPEGWPPGATWDQVTGQYDSARREVVIAVNTDASGNRTFGRDFNLVHETGHAMDHAMGGLSHSPAFMEAFNRDLAAGRLEGYFQSPEEAFAELFAHYYMNDAALPTLWPSLYEWMKTDPMHLGKPNPNAVYHDSGGCTNPACPFHHG